MTEEEITLDDYILTNINIETRGYVIRLKDNKEYQVYVKKPRGQKAYDYIIKDGKEIKLSKEVQKNCIKWNKRIRKVRDLGMTEDKRIEQLIAMGVKSINISKDKYERLKPETKNLIKLNNIKLKINELLDKITVDEIERRIKEDKEGE